MVTASRRTAAGLAAEPTDDVVRAFDEHGFVHVPGLFSEQEVAQFKTVVVNVISAEGTRNPQETAVLGVRDASANRTCDACADSSALHVVALHPRLGALAERLAGMPLRMRGAEVAVKKPQDGPTHLHDDLLAEALNSQVSLTAWVALVDVPVERGCLAFLDGSHRRQGPERIDTPPTLADFEFDDARSYLFTYWPGLRWTPRVTVPVHAGDVTFHHRRTAHMAGANQTEDDRIGVRIVFTDAEATYQPVPGYDPLPFPFQAGQTLPDEFCPRVAASGPASAIGS